MRKIIITTFIQLLVLISITGCTKVDDATLLAAHKAVKNGAVIIDVRTLKEYGHKHINSAINIPIEELSKSLSRVPVDKVLVVYCKSGSRSSAAANILSRSGWKVYDVATQGEYNREVKEPPKN